MIGYGINMERPARAILPDSQTGDPTAPPSAGLLAHDVSLAKTRVFLSYSRHDQDMADWLRKELDAAGIEVFRDIDNTLPGEEWWSRLTDLITLADGVVFLMSARASASKVCAQEVEYARSLNKRIFPAVIEAVDWQAVPEGLARIHSVFFIDVADRHLALAALVSALLTDIVWVRQHTRLLDRARQWQANGRSPDELLTGAALESAEQWLTHSPLSAQPATSLHQEYVKAARDAERAEQERLLRESEEQRRTLQEQRDRAEAAFRAGLDVVSETQQRVLDGLRNTRGVSLGARESIARIMLDSNQRLHQAAPEFYPSSVQQQLAGNELYVVSSLAEIHADQGDFQNAEAEVRRALELSEAYRLEEYNPLQARPGLRQTVALLARLGIIKLQQGEFDEAIDYLRQSVSAGEKGLEYYSKYSDAADFRWHLSCSLQALSVAYLQAGDFAAAVEPAERALQFSVDLASAKPEDRSLQVTLSQMLNSLGDALFETGRLAEAREKFEASYVLFDRLLKEAPDDLFLTRAKSICLERFGNIAMHDKDYAGAIQMFSETLKLKQHLVDADPANWEFQSDLAIITKKLENAESFTHGESDRGVS